MKPIKSAEFFNKKLAALALSLSFLFLSTVNITGCTPNDESNLQSNVNSLEDAKARLRALYYGENKQLTDGSYDKTLAVKCINGTYVGRKTDNVIAYRGIPFTGKAPKGELRWKAPVDVIPDDGVYEAYYNAKSAHGNEEFEIGSLFFQDEDCLYLNVWKSSDNSSEKKPVMVWIHGGAFESGGTVDPMFDCHNLVKENPDIIVVTIAYRLGALGFLHLSHLPDGGDYPDAQNLGLLDQLMALKWVHENIAGFGGDPENVTIFGESAGGGSVTLLPLIKGSHKYFKRVIAQSGAPNQTRTTAQSIEATNELMEILGCRTVADLMKVDAKKIFESSSVLFMRQFPERDGKYLPLDPFDAYAKGAARDIDLLVGCNKNEMNFFVSSFGVDNFNAWASERISKGIERLSSNEKKLVESYLGDIKGESYEPYSRLFSQILFNAPIIRLTENQTKAGGKVYTYYFTPESTNPITKCGHAIELSTVFNHPEMTGDTGRVFDERFSKAMRSMWIQFARTGTPSLSEALSPDGKKIIWQPYDLKNKNVMVLDEFNIHQGKESALKIVDRDRTYFLTKYFWF